MPHFRHVDTIFLKITMKKLKRSAPKIPDSDSLTSFFIPWHKNRAPPIYPNAQTGRIINTTEFLLFFAAILLLILSLGLVGVSVWSLVSKSRYIFVDYSIELAYFALPVSLLCLLCFWIVLSVHNDENSYKYLSLVLILLTFSTVLLVIGVYIGFTHKLHLNSSQIDSSPVLVEFRETMKGSMNKTGIWDDVQRKLGCCGVDNYTDWLAVMQRIPESCCRRKAASCRDNSTSSTGCLKIITATLALQTCLFSGINCVALFIQFCAFVILTTAYFCDKCRQD
ncbi:tetraspanin-9 [Tribolium castaneum]|nr:PREDICTED: tetraspanin-9 isoform X2 [Tribolium castaneum]|eukprot:XP_015834461.1 PREDICTED: tetraspanin-9 isoform X2 [Tribolium castaneum]